MSDEGGECGHSYETKEGTCDNEAKYPDGKCGLHSDYNENQSRSKPSNYKHGIYADRSSYYERQDEKTQAWIDAICESFRKQCGIEEDEHGKIEMLREVAIDFHKRRRANDYIDRRGMTQKQTQGFHEHYGEIETEEENVLHITADRLGRLNVRILKELGAFDDDTGSQEGGDVVLNFLSEED